MKKKSHKSFILVTLMLVMIAGGCFLIKNGLSGAGDELQKQMYPLKYTEYVDKASADHGVEKALIYAVIRTESGFDEEAGSSAGACGLMQLMPDSFTWLQGLRGESLDDDDIMTPSVNIDYGTYLLKYFLDYYDDEKAAVAAYNAGFVVSEWLEDPDYSADGKTLDAIPYDETATYVEKVLSARDAYRKLYFN